MKTIKLYDKMPYSTDFKATVVEVNKNEIILDQTLFFPEEGGQECDLGTINDIPVKDVQIKNDVIVHYVKKHNLQVGDTIEGHIDWKRRYSFMQNHTVEHLLSGIVHSLYGYDNVSFHLNSEEGQVEYDGDIQDIDLIEEKVNQAIYENKEIHCFYPDDLESISYRSKKEIEGKVRIVEIKDYDICACCAPHVNRTGELGVFKIIKVIHTTRGTRFIFLFGERAYHRFKDDFDHLESLYHLFSSNNQTLVKQVNKMYEEKTALEVKYAQLEKEHMLSLCNHAYLFVEDCLPVNQREVTNHLVSVYSTGGVFVGNDEKGYRYVIGSANNALDILTQLKSLKSKGGGSKDMIQGFTPASKTELLKALS
ncbi:alanyl-tRNA editing protein [Catenibacterium mitsuokai]|uniref:alanyl-tRNA editing protein n=1 Tax=Catenibacterium mitsuokai TaxID=100886 RepID=UPI003CFF2182